MVRKTRPKPKAKSTTATKPALRLDPGLRRIIEAEYPRFSAEEMARRRAAMETAMRAADVDHLVVHGMGFRGGAVHWLSDWLTTFEALLVMSPGRRDTLFIQFYNHLPQARKMMPDTEVRWGGASTIQSAIAELEKRGAKPKRVGAVGGLPIGYTKALMAKFDDVADLNRAYFGLRLIKSPEEIAWSRIGARLSDISIAAMIKGMRPGLDEREVGALIEAPYQPWGAVNVIHFLGVTPMRNPDVCVPRQHHSTRKLRKGDAVTTEITCTFWEYGGQVLRTFSLGEKFTPLYRDLHDAAEAAFDAIVKVLKPGTHARELVKAAQVIEDAGFTTYDDLVHGFGGGYLPPVVGSPSRQNEPIPDIVLKPGMMLVVQPNVITKDEKAGVQTGECMLITGTGCERLHTAPRGPFHL
jgi:Xaa-Pro aminopeptidase